LQAVVYGSCRAATVPASSADTLRGALAVYFTTYRQAGGGQQVPQVAGQFQKLAEMLAEPALQQPLGQALQQLSASQTGPLLTLEQLRHAVGCDLLEAATAMLSCARDLSEGLMPGRRQV